VSTTVMTPKAANVYPAIIPLDVFHAYFAILELIYLNHASLLSTSRIDCKTSFWSAPSWPWHACRQGIWFLLMLLWNAFSIIFNG